MLYFLKKSLIFHAIYLFNNIKYFLSLLQIYITVNFGMKRKKETIHPETLCDPTVKDIHLDYNSQLLAKTEIVI